jgi:hypothetical protein
MVSQSSADVCFTPQKRTLRSATAMSAKCQKRTSQTSPKAAGAFAEAVIRSVELIVQPDTQDVVGDLAADISYARELWVACNDHARRCAKAAREPGERRVK